MLASIVLILAAAEAQPQPTPQKPELICRESEQQLGSHIRSGRRCKTAEQWRQEDLRKRQIPTDLTVVPHRGDGAGPAPVTNPEKPF